MAVPTVSSVSPAIGLSQGGELVKIAGSNFRIPSSLPAPPATVSVLFDGAPASDVRVLDSNTLTCLSPTHPATDIAIRPSTTPQGPIAITIANLADDGSAIVGESVTVAAAYAYTLPKHTKEFATDLERVTRAFMDLVRRLGIAVSYAIETDYDPTSDDELHVAQFSKLPGIAIIGPELEENRFYSINEEPEFDTGTTNDDGSPDGFVRTRVPYTVDLRFQIVCASDNKAELLNLQSNFVALMHANKWLYLSRSKDDATQVRFEMDFPEGGHPKSTTVPNNSNLRSWSAEILIRGFDIETIDGIDAGETAGVPNQAIVGEGNTATEITISGLEPAVFDPSRDARLVAWLDPMKIANGVIVAATNEGSAGGAFAITGSPTRAAASLNGTPGIALDGSSSLKLSLRTLFADGKEPIAFVIAVLGQTPTSQSDTIMSLGDTSDGNLETIVFTENTSSFHLGFFRDDDAHLDADQAPETQNIAHVITMLDDGEKISLRIDGALISTTERTTTEGYPDAQLVIGDETDASALGGGHFFLRGIVGHAMLLRDVRTSDDLQPFDAFVRKATGL